jgi:hypothetical protein
MKYSMMEKRKICRFPTLESGGVKMVKGDGFGFLVTSFTGLDQGFTFTVNGGFCDVRVLYKVAEDVNSAVHVTLEYVGVVCRVVAGGV